ncbi:hypothetical protein OIV83_000599 [Microbotryomycetes sp. JL201]|nr:hypothetical protein OIV83_000599 [Microbotryomycetes sp. JL201]
MTKFGLQNDKDNLMAKSHPMGRIGAPEDIAGLLLFLVSRAGSHASGNCIMTDGGSYLAGGGYSRPETSKSKL